MDKTAEAHSHCVLDPGCASRKVFEAVSGRWGPLVIMALKGETKRHGELRRELKGISQKMLIQTLRNLEHNGIVKREVYPVVPLGASLQPLLEAICQWSEQHLEEVEEARQDAGQASFGCSVA